VSPRHRARFVSLLFNLPPLLTYTRARTYNDSRISFRSDFVLITRRRYLNSQNTRELRDVDQ